MAIDLHYCPFYGDRATATVTHACSRGARGIFARRIPASSGVRSRLVALHGLHFDIGSGMLIALDEDTDNFAALADEA